MAFVPVIFIAATALRFLIQTRLREENMSPNQPTRVSPRETPGILDTAAYPSARLM